MIYQKQKNHIDTTIKFLIAISYCLKTDEIGINQNLLGIYLNLKRETINRHIQKLIKLDLLSIEKQLYFNKDKNWKTHKENHWKNNIYKVDINKLNDYLINKYNYDCLQNINNDMKLYTEYRTFYKDYFMDAKVKTRVQKSRQTKLDKLKKKNQKYIDILNKLNNNKTRKIKMSYLCDNKQRLTSELCHTYNPDIHKNSTRYDILNKQYGDNVQYEENDTNASIYRLTYNLNHSEHLPYDVDIYELIYKECDFKVKWTTSIRTQFKKLLMYIYMREWGIKYRCNEYERKKNYKVFYKKSDEQFVGFHRNIIDIFNDTLYNILTTVANAMHKVLNITKFYGANIFIYESNLHILMLDLMEKDNIIASNVYDGFYTPLGTLSKDKFNNYYEQATNILKGVCV